MLYTSASAVQVFRVVRSDGVIADDDIEEHVEGDIEDVTSKVLEEGVAPMRPQGTSKTKTQPAQPAK